MISGAMGQMFLNMIQSYINNLPPDEKEKAMQTIRFVATLDERMSRMEADIAFIKQLLLTENGDDDDGRQIDGPSDGKIQ